VDRSGETNVEQHELLPELLLPLLLLWFEPWQQGWWGLHKVQT
jgi:hypothetical protein